MAIRRMLYGYMLERHGSRGTEQVRLHLYHECGCVGKPSMKKGSGPIPDFFVQRRPHQGMTPMEYRRHLEVETAKTRRAAPEDLDDHSRYLPLNLQRTIRIERKHVAPARVAAAAAAIRKPQLWMVLTEPWCGDSAQNLPYICKIAGCNPRIDLRILLRDQNLDIMDRYLTHGTRSIPKLVAFDESGMERFQWGPRPQAAVEVFRSWKEAGAAPEVVRLKLHLWYARDHGRALEEEFIVLLGSPEPAAVPSAGTDC
jgi:hypothetical protein